MKRLICNIVGCKTDEFGNICYRCGCKWHEMTDGFVWKIRSISWKIAYFARRTASRIGIRRCEQCAKWFFTKVRSEQFCSDKCREDWVPF